MCSGPSVCLSAYIGCSFIRGQRWCTQCCGVPCVLVYVFPWLRATASLVPSIVSRATGHLLQTPKHCRIVSTTVDAEQRVVATQQAYIWLYFNVVFWLISNDIVGTLIQCQWRWFTVATTSCARCPSYYACIRLCTDVISTSTNDDVLMSLNHRNNVINTTIDCLNCYVIFT